MHHTLSQHPRLPIWYSRQRLREVISEIRSHLSVTSEFRTRERFRDLNDALIGLEKVFRLAVTEPAASHKSDNDKFSKIADPVVRGKIPYLMMVDDDEDDRLIFKDEFEERSGIPVEFAASGLALLEYLEACPIDRLPSVVLIDYKMPGLNGSDVLLKLAAAQRYDSVIKVIWSTAQLPKAMDACRKRGAVEFLVKPGSNRELDTVVGKLSAYFGPAVKS